MTVAVAVAGAPLDGALADDDAGLAEDAELAELVERARSLQALPHLQAAGTPAAAPPAEPTEPAGPTCASYAEVLSTAAAQTDELFRAGTHPSLELHRAWAAQALAARSPGGQAAPEDVEATARRRCERILARDLLMAHPDLLREPIVRGPGLALLRERLQQRQATITVFLHSGLITASYADLLGPGTTTFSSADLPAPVSSARDPREAARLQERWQVLADSELQGSRYIGRHRRMDVYRALLLAGEHCSMQGDAPGSGRGVLFGREVRLTTGPAVMAHLTGAPIVVCTPWLRDEGHGVTFSAPLHPADHPTVEELFAAVLRVAEEQLDHDPLQVVRPLPACDRQEFWQRRAQLEAAEHEVAALRVRERSVAERLEQARRRLRELRELDAQEQQARAEQDPTGQAPTAQEEPERAEQEDQGEQEQAAVSETTRRRWAARRRVDRLKATLEEVREQREQAVQRRQDAKLAVVLA